MRTSTGRVRSTSWPGRTISVVSPHLDDAVFSMGAAIAALTRSGRRVQIITPFAGDPESTATPDEWDARCGFRSAGEAARVRRNEDRSACEAVGAEPVWLPFDKSSKDETVGPRLLAEIRDADAVLIPGFPCLHPGHIRASTLVLSKTPTRLGLYVEQPYATWRLLGRRQRVGSRAGNLLGLLVGTGSAMREQPPRVAETLPQAVSAPVRWEVIKAARGDLSAKRRAISAYSTQLNVFGQLLPIGLALYEWRRGGEEVGWLMPN